ncbi:MAG TPA: MlaD family protein [Rhodocyclaceae bacterium]|nr:MlaD family protein [Rhodocyclaceae bacterium]
MDKSSSEAHDAGIERKAVALIVLTLVLIVGFVLYVMTARGLFAETQSLVLTTENSEGVRPGMDLTFSGFPVGRVRRVELADDGQVRILVDVWKKDARWLRTSSIFTLERGIVGEAKLRVFSALLDDPPLPDGEARPLLRGDASEQLPLVLANAKMLIENLERLTAQGSPFANALENVETVTGRMSGKQGVLGAVLGGDEEAKKLIATLDHLNKLLAQTEKRVFATGGLADTSQATLAELQGLLTDARGSLKRADTILANVEGASTDLGALRAEVEMSLRKASRLIDEINRKWPFSNKTEISPP